MTFQKCGSFSRLKTNFPDCFILEKGVRQLNEKLDIFKIKLLSRFDMCNEYRVYPKYLSWIADSDLLLFYISVWPFQIDVHASYFCTETCVICVHLLSVQVYLKHCRYWVLIKITRLKNNFRDGEKGCVDIFSEKVKYEHFILCWNYSLGRTTQLITSIVTKPHNGPQRKEGTRHKYFGH